MIPVNTGGEGGSEDFGLSQGFQRERRGSSCVQKSTKGDNRKLIPVNMEEGRGGEGGHRILQSFMEGSGQFKLRKHFV